METLLSACNNCEYKNQENSNIMDAMTRTSQSNAELRKEIEKYQSGMKGACPTCEIVAIENERYQKLSALDPVSLYEKLENERRLNEELQAENAKLREVVSFYAVRGLADPKVGQRIDEKLCHEFYVSGGYARQVLKELDGKRTKLI